jgi:hypothetical protein
MSTLAFEIRDASKPLDGYEGETTLAGMRTGDDGGDLNVGDVLLIPLANGDALRAAVVQFPLLSFADPDLRAISVAGVAHTDVLIGGRAERVTD